MGLNISVKQTKIQLLHVNFINTAFHSVLTIEYQY